LAALFLLYKAPNTSLPLFPPHPFFFQQKAIIIMKFSHILVGAAAALFASGGSASMLRGHPQQRRLIVTGQSRGLETIKVPFADITVQDGKLDLKAPGVSIHGTDGNMTVTTPAGTIVSDNSTTTTTNSTTTTKTTTPKKKKPSDTTTAAVANNDNRRSLETIHVPFTDINIGSNGSISINGPGVNINGDNHGLNVNSPGGSGSTTTTSTDGGVDVQAPGVNVTGNTITAPGVNVTNDGVTAPGVNVTSNNGSVTVTAPGVNASHTTSTTPDDPDSRLLATISVPFVDITIPDGKRKKGDGNSSSSSSESSDTFQLDSPWIHIGSDGVVIGDGSSTGSSSSIISTSSSNDAVHKCHLSNVDAAQTVKDDTTCKKVLPKFYDNTSEGKWNRLDGTQRLTVMNDFCGSKCAAPYAAFLAATQVEDRECRHQRLVTGHSRSEKKATTTTTTSRRNRRDGDEEDEDDHRDSINDLVNDVTDGINDIFSSGKKEYIPAYSYPGLLLGCTKDGADGSYCALKVADASKGGCDFYMSCCYGEYLAGRANTTQLVAKFEEKCPGSTTFASQRCVVATPAAATPGK